jgi:Spy/CpxP family protein refolding chaperone
MKLWKVIGASVVAGALSVGFVAQAQDKAAKGAEKAAAKEKAPAKAKAPKLPGAYANIASLTEEQKAKLSEIWAKADAERKAIEEKARTDMNAVLTDAQRAELQAAQQKPKAEKPKGKAGEGAAEKPAK